MTFLVLIKKEIKKANKKGEQMAKTISYKLKFIVSARFMANSLSNLVDNLAAGIHTMKYKDEHEIKNVENVELNTKIVSVVLNILMLKMIN